MIMKYLPLTMATLAFSLANAQAQQAQPQQELYCNAAVSAFPIGIFCKFPIQLLL
jgi:hypothetical protein